MAITQSQADKNWQDSPSTSTPILSADLKAMSKTNRDYRWMAPSSATSIDEFDDDTLDAAWVRVDGTGATSGNATWTEKGDVVSLYMAGGDSANVIRGLVRPLSGFGGSVSAGDAFVISLRLCSSGTFTMGGIVLSDGTTHGAGNQVVANSYLTTSNVATTFNAWGGSNWSLSGTTSDVLANGNELHLRLVCVSSTTWRCDASPDGISWLIGAGVTTKTITPTHVGLMCSTWGTSTKAVISFQYLRRVSGVS